MEMSADESMLDVYIYENQQLLETLETILLEGEEEKILTAEQINEVFRVMHTVKGASSMMEFEGLAHLAHAVEDVFARIREAGAPASQWPSVFDLVFQAVSFFNQELARLQESGTTDGEAVELIEKLHHELAQLKGEQQSSAAAAAPAQQSQPAAQSAAQDQPATGIPYYKIKIFFEAGCQMEAIRALGVVQALKSQCTSMAYIPADLNASDASQQIISQGFCMYAQVAGNPDDLKKVLDQTMFLQNYAVLAIDGTDEEIPESIRQADHSDAAADVHKSTNEAPRAAAENVVEGLAKQNFISVNVNKLDHLLNIVGEIVTAQSMVVNSANYQMGENDHFDASTKQLRSLINELQDVVMSARMLPVSTVFQKMRRLVRDMSKRIDKEIELRLIGEETEVDKNVIDCLSDPLMHIIRNSIDHGIEDAATRAKNGKSVKGRITLEAHTTGSDVVVTVSDDGKGLQRDVILKKAYEKGLVTKPQSEISDKEAYSMIFLPGFSTKEVVTEFSGRGVGMDVVRRNINQIGGSLSVESEPGHGTKHIIRIPLTLTIVDGLKFNVGNISCIIPTVAVRSAVRPTEKDVFTDSSGNEMMLLQGKCYSLVRLSNIFNVEPQAQSIEEGMVLHVSVDENSFCIFFDALDGEYQVVVKTLPAYMEKCTTSQNGISGCAIMGDGSINLILDVNTLCPDGQA